MEKRFRITVDGREYVVTVEELSDAAGQLYPQPGSMSLSPPPVAAPVAATVAAERAPAGAGDVTSSLGGVVESILVGVGQHINQGDKVAIVEAMKMKSPMIAPRAGQVAAIAVKAGDTVDAGQVLVRLA